MIRLSAQTAASPKPQLPFSVALGACCAGPGLPVCRSCLLQTGAVPTCWPWGRKGEIWIVEIKSSPADYLSDSKWRDYMDFCDRFYFAIPLTWTRLS
jgi:hypothetical protein